MLLGHKKPERLHIGVRETEIGIRGGDYHVINRGNYRKDLFGERGAAAAFENTLFEACVKCGWKIHAYVMMSNHFHLAVETPEANWVSGMAWLQGTFANRFNRFHGERGHAFQSRYKSILIEEWQTLFPWGTPAGYPI
jgi:REP element-mobilizing transposase RayT